MPCRLLGDTVYTAQVERNELSVEARSGRKRASPYGGDAYLEWIQREGLPVHDAFAMNLFRVDTGDWPRYGTKGAVCRVDGSDECCSLILMEIRAGASTLPVQHLYEAIYCVLQGRGHTEFVFAGGQKADVEWGPRSLFTVPLNAKHRHFNSSSTERALVAMTITAPLVMRLFRNESFIFETPFEFERRDTNLVRDVLNAALVEPDCECEGAPAIGIVNGIMHGYISEAVAACSSASPHWVRGMHLMALSDNAYSLLGPNSDSAVRVDWEYGTVFVPGGQAHRHVVTGREASRYLATGIGGQSDRRLTRPHHHGTDDASPAVPRVLRELERLAVSVAADRILCRRR